MKIFHPLLWIHPSKGKVSEYNDVWRCLFCHCCILWKKRSKGGDWTGEASHRSIAGAGDQQPTEYRQTSAAAAAAKSLQSCPTLCDPIDGSPPGPAVAGILQARTLEWVAISSSNAWKWKVKVTSLSRVQLLATPWTAAYQAPPSMGFSRQEYDNQIHEVPWRVLEKTELKNK